jgi:hypothetical protein
MVWIRSRRDVHAFLWNPVTGMPDLGDLGGGFSISTGINTSGQVTGYSVVAAGPNPGRIAFPVRMLPGPLFRQVIGVSHFCDNLYHQNFE